ncbi:hypothetical protein O6467_23170, partial [Salmonella enterica subsp. enterica]
ISSLPSIRLMCSVWSFIQRAISASTLLHAVSNYFENGMAGANGLVVGDQRVTLLFHQLSEQILIEICVGKIFVYIGGLVYAALQLSEQVLFHVVVEIHIFFS